MADLPVYQVCVSIKKNLFCRFACPPPPAASLFSRFRLWGAQEPFPYTVAHVWARAELRGACSGRPKSRELALFQGDCVPRRPSLAGPWKPHNLGFSLFCCCCITPALKLSSSLRHGDHDTTAFARQALPFVTATDGVSVCPCVPCFLSF